MRTIITIAFFTAVSVLCGQNLKPSAFSVAYLGETVTHPGIKVTSHHRLAMKLVNKTSKKGNETKHLRELYLSPELGMYYHKAYQTGIFVLPVVSYRRTKEKGTFIDAGVGIGYLRTQLPSVYTINAADQLVKVRRGNNQLLLNAGIAFGKRYHLKNGSPISPYIKPAVQCALPSAVGMVYYLMLETGIRIELNRKD